MNKQVRKNNRFDVRIFNFETLKKIDEIIALGKFSSKNELINKCIEMSVDDIKSGALGKFENLYREHESKCDKLAHEVNLRAKQQDKKLSELYVEILANQQILLSVFNMLLLSNKDKADVITRGLLTDKPKYIEDFYLDMQG